MAATNAHCDHPGNPPNARYCATCGIRLPDPEPNASSRAPVKPNKGKSTGLAARNQSDELAKLDSNVIRRAYAQLYKLEEELNGGTLMWELGGKHLAAYRARLGALEVSGLLAKVQKNAYVRAHQQAVDAGLASRQAESEDGILGERLVRQAISYVEFVAALSEVLSQVQDAEHSTEELDDIVASLIRRAEEGLFNSSVPHPSRSSVPGLLNSGPFITEVDEF
jgi:hypothetical protein